MPSSIIYLLGYPGVGKYTLAREIAQRTGASVVDNHLINNPVFSLLGLDGTRELPPGVWQKIAPIREAVLSTIEEIAPPSLSYILTNVLEESGSDIALYRRIEEIAVRRDAVFVPVFLTCDLDEHLRRVVQPDRAERFKWSDPDAIRAYVLSHALYRPEHPNFLTVDTTSVGPAEGAETIVRHVVACAARPAIASSG